jgi:hypothetical protein
LAISTLNIQIVDDPGGDVERLKLADSCLSLTDDMGSDPAV